jgi:hypothetical protein
VGIVERIKNRSAKEEIEREATYMKGAPEREERFKQIDKLLLQYDEVRRKEPYMYPEDARHIFNHITDEYGHDLVGFFRRVRGGKQP